MLWAPWRLTYVAGEKPAPGSCIFCDLPRAPDARDSLVLHATAETAVLLNRYPYNPGHLLIAPRRHAADFGALPEGEFTALMGRLRDAIAVVHRELLPDGVNVGLNLGAVAGAGIADHLHWHVVPRWNGDTNFMPVIGETKVIPQLLLESWDRLAPQFR